MRWTAAGFAPAIINIDPALCLISWNLSGRTRGFGQSFA